jgi:hypothetical protein
MSKIIKLNETDLKRIVKKVLTERQQLNEIWLWIAGAVALAGVGQEVYNWWASGDARERAASVFQMCSRGGVEGKPIATQSEIENLVKRYHEACPGKGMFTNCDEDEMISILRDVKSIPDLCGVIQEFNTQGYGSMWELTVSAMDTETYWEKLNNALTPAFKKSQEANKKSQEQQKDQGSGSSDPNVSVSGEGDVSDLQQLLKDKGFDIGSHGVDGKIGPDTLEALIKAVKSLPSGKKDPIGTQTVDEHYLRMRKNIYRRK